MPRRDAHFPRVDAFRVMIAMTTSSRRHRQRRWNATGVPLTPSRHHSMRLRRPFRLVLVVTLAVGLGSCGRAETPNSHPAGEQNQIKGSAREAPTGSTPRLRNDSDRRYCPLAALATPIDLAAANQLRGSVHERAMAVAALRIWDRLLRQAAPSEIANAVDILTRISDDYYDMAEAIDFDFKLLVPDAQDAFDNPTAKRAHQQHA